MYRMRAQPTLTVAICILLCGILLTAINMYELHRIQALQPSAIAIKQMPLQNNNKIDCTKPVYWVQGKNVDSGYLKHVFSVFDRLGLKRGSENTDWDVMWAHDYPFRTYRKLMLSLKPHQKVNHFPGSGYITNKVSLATTSDLKHVPKAFEMPKEKHKLLDYSKKHSKKMFVQKSSNHRGIRIERINDLDLDSNGTFVQEYVQNPFLIDGHKFDIGIYAILTSINPLRVYIYSGDALLRFCPDKYYPFSADVLDKYVVGDDYLPIWKVPSLKTFYTELKMSMKESLNAYLTSEGKDYKLIWEQIEECIRIVFQKKEKSLMASSKNFQKSIRNFFEMMRFDFVLDENLQVYLMEANMSPNLSSAHFKQNRLLYEQVVFSVLSLAGIARKVHGGLRLTDRSVDESDMQVADKDISVFANDCISSTCLKGTCTGLCRLCNPCLSADDRRVLKQAANEMLNKGMCRRILPPPLTQNEASTNSDSSEMSDMNRLMHLWFNGKCLQDPFWCH